MSISILNDNVIAFTSCPEVSVVTGEEIVLRNLIQLRLRNSSGTTAAVTLKAYIRSIHTDTESWEELETFDVPAGDMPNARTYEQTKPTTYASAGLVVADTACKLTWEGGESQRRQDSCSFRVLDPESNLIDSTEMTDE